MKKKMMALCLCVALVAVAAVGATMAYFTDTKDVTNTFAVGNVKITLDETKVHEDGTAVAGAARTEEGNAYKLFPGHTYTKDPMVTVQANSEESYVRMLVEVKNIDQLKAAFPQATYPDYYAANGVFLLQKLVGEWDNAIWTSTNTCTEKIVEGATYGTYEFRYKSTVVKADTNTALEPLFTTFTIPKTATSDDIAKLENVEIKVIANAIQADTFENAAEAWAAFDAE